jgi:molybdopterin-guanine dinucleotide biosynthesis protein MobB
MKVFGIAGYKNAGKTTLMVELIREFRSRGLRVATVKHAHHEFDIDHPGKDSFQHREAGAEEVIVASSRRWAQIRELDGVAEPSLEELLNRLSAVDLVLVEGYKHGSQPKLELRRGAAPAPEIATAESNIKAIVSDIEVVAADLPVLDRANLKLIADFILENAEPLEQR